MSLRLAVKSLAKSFWLQQGLFGKREFKAVQNVNFKLRKGHTLGVVVESGAGKTTVGLTLNPEVLVLDEAVSALDVSVQAQVLNLLKDLQDEFGLSYVFISHDLAVVRFISDEVLVMKDGGGVEQASAAQMLASPREDYTKRLLEAIPRGYRKVA